MCIHQRGTTLMPPAWNIYLLTVKLSFGSSVCTYWKFANQTWFFYHKRRSFRPVRKQRPSQNMTNNRDNFFTLFSTKFYEYFISCVEEITECYKECFDIECGFALCTKLGFCHYVMKINHAIPDNFLQNIQIAKEIKSNEVQYIQFVLYLFPLLTDV